MNLSSIAVLERSFDMTYGEIKETEAYINAEDIEVCVREAIKDILPDAKITIYNTPSIYTDFTNSIIISIVQEDFDFYYYL